MRDWKLAQSRVCRRYGAMEVPVADSDKLGIAVNVRSGLLPINGLRLTPDGRTCGWYIWAGGAMSDHADFFSPLHVAHLESWNEIVMPYLSLPPGWRFLVTPDHEDVCEQASLLGPEGWRWKRE